MCIRDRYNVAGEWNFYRHPADSSVVPGDIRQLNDLKAYNVTLASYIRGNLEDWTAGALNFNGTGTYCSISGSSFDMPTNNFIIETYFRTVKGSVSKILVSKYSGSGSGYILDVNATGNARMRLLTGGSDAYTLASSAVVNDGNWHHVLAEVIRSGSVNVLSLIHI